MDRHLIGFFVVQRDAGVPDGDIKRAYAFAIRRMSKPALLRDLYGLTRAEAEITEESNGRYGDHGVDCARESRSGIPIRDWDAGFGIRDE